MTQAKAASLTNELFARKGTASPASLVIAELKEEGGDTPSLPAQRNKGRGSESSERKKASLPQIEQDLPLLAFVDAQTAKDGTGGNALDFAQGETDTGGRELRGEEGTLDPAGSLLVHRPLAFSMTADGEVNGTDEGTDEPVPAAEAKPAAAANGAAHAQEATAEVTAFEEVGDDLGTVPAKAATAAPDTGQAGVAVDWAQALEVVEAELVVEGSASEEPRPEDPPAEESPIEESAAAEQPVEPSPKASPEPLQMPAVDNAAGMGAPVTESHPASADAPAEEPAPAPEDTPAEPSDVPATAREDEDGDAAEAQAADKDADGPAQPDADDAAAGPAGDRRGDDKDAEKTPGLRLPPVDLSDQRRKAAAWRGKAIAGPSVVKARERHGGDRSLWRMAAVVVVGVALGFAGYAFWPKGEQAPQPGTNSNETADAAGVGAASTEGSELLAEAGDAPTAAASVAAEARDSEGSASGDVPVVPAAAAPEQTAAADGGEASPDPASAAAAEAEPSFDIIRIESNGQSIIAGRAEPFSEWILLNNSEPIGTVRADINGEWVILPGAALVQGANKFSLVPKSEQGAVELPALQQSAPTPPAPTPPAPTQPAEAPPVQTQPAEASAPESAQDSVLAPHSDAGPALQGTEEVSPPVPGVALPILKPAGRPGTPATPGAVAAARLSSDGSYEVQLASVRQSGAADRERARLIDDYPALLGDLELRVEEARLDGAGIFYRLRTGPIKELSDARELCRQLERRGQGCLVVVRAAEATPPPLPRDAEHPAQVAPTPTAPAAASTQQAENPD